MNTQDHNRIIDQAFGSAAVIPQFQLSAQELVVLKNASREADDLWSGGQSRDASFKHAMRAWGQSQAEAEATFNAWVRYCLNLAADLQRGGSHVAALHRLGFGMHALADSHSPAHVGFQGWGGDGPLNVPGAIRHHFREKPTGDAMRDAVRDLHIYYYKFLQKSGLDLPVGPS